MSERKLTKAQQLTLARETKIRDDERKRCGEILIGAAKTVDFDPETKRVLREIGKIFRTKTTKQLVHEALVVMVDEIIDADVAAGKGERITIRGKPGYRAFAQGTSP
jgi:hypothetical protein